MDDASNLARDGISFPLQKLHQKARNIRACGIPWRPAENVRCLGNLINYNKSNCLDEDVLAHLFDWLSGTPCRMLNTKPRPFWAISKETLLITKHLR